VQPALQPILLVDRSENSYGQCCVVEGSADDRERRVGVNHVCLGDQSLNGVKMINSLYKARPSRVTDVVMGAERSIAR